MYVRTSDQTTDRTQAYLVNVGDSEFVCVTSASTAPEMLKLEILKMVYPARPDRWEDLVSVKLTKLQSWGLRNCRLVSLSPQN